MPTECENIIVAACERLGLARMCCPGCNGGVVWQDEQPRYFYVRLCDVTTACHCPFCGRAAVDGSGLPVPLEVR